MSETSTPATTAADSILVAMTGPIAVNKENAKACAAELTARVIDYRLKPMVVWERLSFYEAVAEAFKTDSMKALLAAEIGKDSAGTGRVIGEGGTFATRAVGTTFDFDDQLLSDLETAQAAIKEQITRRREFLKTLAATTEEKYLGAKLIVKPPIKKSRDGFAFTMHDSAATATAVPTPSER